MKFVKFMKFKGVRMILAAVGEVRRDREKVLQVSLDGFFVEGVLVR